MPKPPSWLAEIGLVTFDCFGTLLDWRAALLTQNIDDAGFARFEKASLDVQLSDAWTPYRDVLQAGIKAAEPSISPARAGLFARDFGRLCPPFADARGSLRLLRDTVKVGLITNCDFSHGMDVTAALGTGFDVLVVAEELRAYKPTARAWDAGVRSVIARTAVTRDAWLHVSAWDHYDLGPAKERGLRTCFIERPGGTPKAVADLHVANLNELVDQIVDAREGPTVYMVRAECKDDYTAVAFRSWMLDEHLADVRACPGVREARLVSLGPRSYISLYTFATRLDYLGYDTDYAPALQQRGKERFGERVAFDRSVGRVQGIR